MNLASNSPASNYQKQKLIQNTVRVASSNYTMNVGALSVYQSPKPQLNVNWNQQSDRAVPHIQTLVSSPGTNPGGNSRKRSLTRCRPGALSPGGVGVDIKHNSYDRYLARIKGKAPLRRQLISTYQIDMSNQYPVRGGKYYKTNIVNGCNCETENTAEENAIINANIMSYDLIGPLNNAMFNGAGCDTQQETKCPCPPVYKVITEFLNSCPKNEVIYVL
jgi:hypothetical protein